MRRRDAKVRADALQRLGLLYTEKVENSAKAIDAWQQLLAIDENNRRAQDALKKLYVTEGRWDELEEFYRSRGKIDEYIRVLEREVEAGSEHASALARDEDRGALPRRAAEGRSRDARVREGALARREQPRRRRGADPALRDGPRSEGARPRARDPAARDATDDQLMRQERIKRLAQYNEEKLRDKGAAFGWWLKAHAEDHESEEIRAADRAARRRDRQGWNQLVDAYAASLPKFEHKDDALPLMLVMARVIEKEQGDVDRALDMNRQILELDERNEQALDALERLYLGKGQFEELLEHLREEARARRTIADERIAIQSKIGQLYEDEVKDDKKAVAAYHGDPRRGRRRADRAAQPRSHLRPQPAVEGARRHPRPPDHDRRARREQARARRAEVPARPAQGAAPRRRRRARSMSIATSSTSTSVTRARASRSRSICAATTSRS